MMYVSDFQDIAPPPKVNTYPLVDFISFESEIQAASQYPSTVEGNPIYTIP